MASNVGTERDGAVVKVVIDRPKALNALKPETLRLGLLNRVTPAAELMSRSLDFARVLAEKTPIAIQEAKASVGASTDLDLENGGRYESEAFAVCFGTEDRREGMRAFLEKRAAEFSGK